MLALQCGANTTAALRWTIYFGSNVQAGSGKWLLYLILERQSHELSRTATNFPLFVHDSSLAFGVFLTDSCSISEYILVNRDGILANSCDSSQMQPIPPNNRNAIVSVTLQYRKASRMDTKSHEIPRILKFINSRFVGVRVVV